METVVLPFTASWPGVNRSLPRRTFNGYATVIVGTATTGGEARSATMQTTSVIDLGDLLSEEIDWRYKGFLPTAGSVTLGQPIMWARP